MKTKSVITVIAVLLSWQFASSQVKLDSVHIGTNISGEDGTLKRWTTDLAGILLSSKLYTRLSASTRLPIIHEPNGHFIIGAK